MASIVNWENLRNFGMVLTLYALGYIYLYLYPDGPIFNHLLYVQDFPGATLVVTILLLAGGWVSVSLDTDSFVLAVARHRFVIAGALWIALALGTLLVYQNHPLSMDEYAAVFQATVFSNGSLHGQVPADLVDQVVPVGFQKSFFAVNHHTGHIASGYWPGFALLLTPFTVLGIRWALNPLIVSVSLLVIGKLAFSLTNNEKARGWAILLALASPCFVLNGISFYSMPAHMLANLVFALLLIDPVPWRVLLAGIVGSFALVLHNPFPHLLFSLPWIIWLVFWHPDRRRNLLLLAAGYLPSVLLLGLGWIVSLTAVREGATAVASASAVTQTPWILRIVEGLLQPFRWPAQATLLFRLGDLIKLWLWSAPLLPLIAAIAVVSMRRRPLKLLGLSMLVTITGYFFVPVSQGHGWGDRYAHSAWGVLPVLAAIWLAQTSNRETQEHSRISQGILICSVISLIAANCLRTWQIGSFVGGHLAMVPALPLSQSGIVFMRGGYYGLDLVQNDPWMRNKQLILVSKGNASDMRLATTMLPGGCKYSENDYGWTYAVLNDCSLESR